MQLVNLERNHYTNFYRSHVTHGKWDAFGYEKVKRHYFNTKLLLGIGLPWE